MSTQQKQLQGNPVFQKEFIKLYLELFSITEVCKKLNISRQSFYQVRENDPDFKREYDKAINNAFSDVEVILSDYLHSNDPKLVMWATDKLLRSRRLEYLQLNDVTLNRKDYNIDNNEIVIE